MMRPFKLVLLVLGAPVYFGIIAGILPRCGDKPGFRGWYWRFIKRACSRLLWLVDVNTEISPTARAAMADDTGSIIVVNHRSHLDGFTLMDTLPDEKWFTFAAKKELFDSGLLARGFRCAGLVEIDRKQGKIALDTLTEAIRAMPDRRSVVLFIEGTRTGGDSLGAFKPGAILAARETGRSIRPIVLTGSDKLLPRGKNLPKPGTVRINVLDTFHPDLTATVDEDVARLRMEMCKVFDGTAKGV